MKIPIVRLNLEETDYYRNGCFMRSVTVVSIPTGSLRSCRSLRDCEIAAREKSVCRVITIKG